MKPGLYQTDCLLGMDRIEDESIPLILCDLPYGTTKYSWDTPITLRDLWAQYRRILAPNGTIVLFGKEPFSSQLRMSALDLYKYDWQWIKSRKGGYQQANGQPLDPVENVCVFSKGSTVTSSSNRLTYNPQDTYTRHLPVCVQGKVEIVASTSNYPNTILEYPNVPISELLHPAQKPVSLLMYLIRTHSNEGDVVLDNCCGVGSTLIAARDTARQFIGFETNETFVGIAHRRLSTFSLKATHPRKKRTSTPRPHTKTLLPK